MGRSKFPGKPSKFVNKKRVSVLQTDENNVSSNDDSENGSGNDGGNGNGSSGSGRRDDSSSGGNNVNEENSEENDRISSRNHRNGTLTETTKFDSSSAGTGTSSRSIALPIDTANTEYFQKMSVSQSQEKPPSSEPPDGGGNDDLNLKISGVTTRARNTNNGSITQGNCIGGNIISLPSNTTNTSSKKEKNLVGADKQPTKKKTVTFKNILETSDDACTVKKVYNPDNKAPLVPIIKKECLSRSVRFARNDCIVRPSRLTEILKNNANNIDKLNFLKFRSNPSNVLLPPKSLSPSNQDSNVPLSTNLKSSPLLENTDFEEDDIDNSSKSEKGVVVGDKRFILPKRSAHSCRVIKPNKRFLDDTELFTKSSINSRKTPNQNLGVNPSANKKTNKVFSTPEVKSLCGGDLENNKNQKSRNLNGTGTDCIKQPLTMDTESELDNLSEASNATDETHSDILEGEEGDYSSEEYEMENNTAFVSNPFTRCNKSLFNTMTSTNKVILRQPRLQFDTQNLNLFEQSNSSPFSLNLNSNSKSAISQLNLASSNLCGVCSTTIMSKTQQQSKKYGIYACDVCRKFISKITKKAVSSTSTVLNHQSHMILHCNRGDGSCPIVPLAKINLKNLKKSYKDRCPACWLKKSIQLFNIPSGHKQRLSSILPTTLIQDIAIDCKNALKTNGNSIMTTITTKSSSPFSIKKDANATITSNEKTSINLFIHPAKKLLSWKSSSSSENLFDSNSNINLNGAITTIDTINQKPATLSLSNSLLENNITFGVLPLTKPTVLEKPVFMKGKSEEMACNVANSNDFIEKYISKLDNNNKGPLNNKANAKVENIITSVNSDNNKIKLRRKDKDSQIVTNSEVTSFTTMQSSTISSQNMIMSSLSNVLNDHPKRQRIDLKGPRVKHVCRSASIVLGQPIATFSNDTPILESMDTPPRPESPTNDAEVEMSVSMITDTSCTTCSLHEQHNHDDDVTNLGLSPPATPIENYAPDECSNDDELKEKEIFPNVSADTVKDNNTKMMNLNVKFDENQRQLGQKKSITPRLPLNTSNSSNNNITNIPIASRSLGSFSKKYLKHPGQKTTRKQKISAMISIDFWENYDPAEVSQSGFGLIVTESIPMRALCFLCGSTGVDQMIFCACCCEPYHQYCVEDEYNLKHSSLDETMLSLLDTSLNPVENLNLITNRLNWLCPRCTVCYTCNMSSGSKVKCQKCQKNYHTTCLGTSKRLLGADRPLICVNCLKCKSCSTTKVSKFVGNLPMCSQCFKLRKKGNFCPICQKCYEENDFDLKMMECGDCQRWVHSRCEGLTDEQYNLLSTLPESIEFICRKCSKLSEQSKERATEWRDAVSSEFKSGLLSVVKLLSKSRQACALLKLSPRKKTTHNCVCQSLNNGAVSRSLNFNKLETQTNSDCESQDSDEISMEDVYEFKDINKSSQITDCYCTSKLSSTKYVPDNDALSLVDIKRKVNASEYISLSEFNYDMNNVILAANCDDLIITYKEILSEQFPWFQNETKACTDALEEDMFDSCGYSQSVENVDNDQQVPVIDLPNDIDDCLYSPNFNEDTRVCNFCKKCGESESSQESRLIYCGQNSWVHINCAMWSAEVFEEIDGSLQNVHSAISRGRMIKCTVCNNRGATIGCNVKSCGEHYHFSCAKRINCAFMTDKTVFCPEHIPEVDKIKFTLEKNFEVLRPVYVELDRKRKKLVDPIKVKFLIGSLEIKKIGRIFPKFSDTNEAIVPIDFHCTRLYWSTKEPWKIVEYTVTTSIQNNLHQYSNDLGRNFTVDHSNNISLVQLGLTQISRWHNSLLLDEDIDMSSTFYRQSNSLKQLIESSAHIANTSEDGNDEEPQSNADLLPPEIKDAIFEDLPHEILDGISMLDIFPKLMIYEDMITMDSKTESFFLNDHSKDNTGNNSDDDGEDEECNQKELEFGTTWSSNTLVNHVEDAMLSGIHPLGSGTGREIKRSKSELISRSVGGNRSQQRSSSLTWGCKFDNNSIKRRKITKGLLPESVLFSLGHRKLDFPPRNFSQQIDEGTVNNKTKTFLWSVTKKSQDSDCVQLKDEKLKISQLDGMDDSILESVSSYQHQLFSNGDGPVKCIRCQCTYRSSESFQRHLATCEAFSTSESESETAPRSPDAHSPNNNQSHLLDSNKPHQHQQNIQQQPISFIQNLGQSMPMTSIQNNLISTNNGLPLTTFNGATLPLNNVQIQNLQSNGIPMTQFNQGIQNIFVNNTTTQHQQQQQSQQQFYPVSLQSLNTTNMNNVSFSSSSSSSVCNPTISFSTSGIQQHQIQQPQVFTMSTADGNQQVVTITPNGQQQQTIRTSTNQIYQQHGQQILRSNFETTKQSPTKLSKYSKLSQSPKTKQKMASSVRPIQMKKKAPTIVHHQQQSSVQILNQNQMPQQQNSFILQQSTNGGQPIILQQIGGNQTTTTQTNVPQNLLSYVTDNGQNQLQYVTLPNTGDYKPPQQQFLTTTNQLVQGAYLQADASGNLVLTNGAPGLQMLSAAPLQLQSAQPQVIGTLIQPQTLQLGGSVMSTDQMMLGGTPTLEMLGNQMILANQPVYYGLETIVQNTVMQSQQFVSTAMQGVLSQNASFSATTTQVFQASKIEPIVDVPTAGYVVLNNVDGSATIVQQPASHTNLLSANVLQQPTLTQIQSQHIHNPQPQQQINNQQVQPIYSIQTPQQTVTHSAILHPNQIQQHSTNHTQQPTIINNSMGSSAQTTIQSNPSVNQTHHRSISPTKPVAKSAPIVMTKIQPQVVNKVVPTLSSDMLIQEHKQTNQFRSSKTVTIAPATNGCNSEAFMLNPISALNNTSSVKAVKSTSTLLCGQQIIKPKVSNFQTSLPVNSVQRKTNMIKPLNKVSSISIKQKSKTAKNTLNTKISENNALKLSMVQQQSTSNAFEVKQQVSAIAMQQALKAVENPVSFVESNVLSNACKFKQVDQIKIMQSKDLSMTDSEEMKTNDTKTTIAQISKNIDFMKLKGETVSNDESNKNVVINVQDFSESKAASSYESKETKIIYTQNQQQPTLTTQQFQFTMTSSCSNPTQNSPPVTVTTSSIQLPSAPFVVSSFNNILNGNVPTNIVNPIQQNQSSPIVSRPTNRVLPMQSVQLKQQLASPKQTHSISKSNPEKSLNINKHIRDTEVPINSPTFDIISKERHIIDSIDNQIDDTRTDETLCKSDCLSNITDMEQFNEVTTEVTIPIDSGKDFKPEDENENENFKLDFNEEVNANNDFNMKQENNEIPSLPDCDNLSDSTTPEVQEKISEILENLENEECDKRSLLVPDNFNADNISPVLNKVEITNQKENNMNPINKNCSESAFKLCPIKSEDEKCNDEFKPSGPKLLYEIQSEDGFTYKSTSIADVWEKVFEAVQVARKAHGLLPLPEGPLADMSGIQMLGLKTNALRYLIEQLPGVERCTKYTPKYHKQQVLPCSNGYSSDQEDLKENPYSAARLQPYTSRSEYDMFSWLASRHRRQPIQIFLQPSDNELIPRRGTGSNLPMAMKYRTLKETYKDYVGVFRSHIHGRGLYCKKDIEAGEMVIEYAGELIRSTLTDKRERYYDSKGIGCYMFKIDENLVVDATMRGNAARFINHACEPNCYSKVVDILGHKHIIIFALRRIVQGEELTYDYKFPFEEIKIPCSCGSKKCRKYLN